MKQYKNEKERLGNKYSSPMHYILSGLIPYTEANLKLAFRPHAFFNDLEKIDSIKANKQSLKSAYYRAVKRGLIVLDDAGNPRLTEKGRRKIQPYKPVKLKIGARLIVIFDIPEQERYKRTRMRTLLRELSFQQIQKSVWESRYDHREYLRLEIAEMQLHEYVKVYEASQIEV